MAGINEQFASVPLVNDIGLVSGTPTATQFPNLETKLVRFKAYAGNDLPFYLGEDENNMFFEISAGDDTGWIPLENLNRLYFQNASGTGQYLAYWRQA